MTVRILLSVGHNQAEPALMQRQWIHGYQLSSRCDVAFRTLLWSSLNKPQHCHSLSGLFSLLATSSYSSSSPTMSVAVSLCLSATSDPTVLAMSMTACLEIPISSSNFKSPKLVASGPTFLPTHSSHAVILLPTHFHYRKPSSQFQNSFTDLAQTLDSFCQLWP